ncbi:MAG TPA: sigma-70 family RNA polymerase sigma factor, partial [Actinomycetota bacterium]|nr:sigma-70 family RNA polymerase sigma factor [Actinomycetota bacterium]
WAIRVPRPLQELAVRVSGLMPELWQELGRSPTIPEIAERVGADEDEVLEALDAAQAYTADPLETPTGDEGRGSIADSLGVHDEEFERLEGWRTVAPLIKRLPERERAILYLRFFEEKTQSQIAEELGISQMHVSRLLSRTLDLLRQHAEG